MVRTRSSRRGPRQPSDIANNHATLMKAMRTALKRYGYNAHKLSDEGTRAFFEKKFGARDVDTVHKHLKMRAVDLRPKARALGWTHSRGNLIALDRFIQRQTKRSTSLINTLRSETAVATTNRTETLLQSEDLSDIRTGIKAVFNKKNLKIERRVLEGTLDKLGADSKMKMIIRLKGGSTTGITITPKNKLRLVQILSSRLIDEHNDESGVSEQTTSEESVEEAMGQVESIDIEMLEGATSTGRANNRDNGYFPFNHKLNHLDLSRLQIWSADQMGSTELGEFPNAAHRAEHCLIFAIRRAVEDKQDITEDEKQRILSTITGVHSILTSDVQHVPATTIKKICELYGIRLEVDTIEYRSDGAIRKGKPNRHGSKANPTILKLATWKNHLFANEKPMDVSHWFLYNYTEDLPEKALLWTEKGKHKQSKCLKQFPLDVAIAIQRREAELLESIKLHESNPLIQPTLSLDNLEKEQRPVLTNVAKERMKEEESEPATKSKPKTETVLRHYVLDCESDVTSFTKNNEEAKEGER